MCLGLGDDRGQSAAEFRMGTAERAFGIDVEPAREVDDGEEQIADFVFDLAGLFGCGVIGDGMYFGDFFGDFVPYALDVGPVEGEFCSFARRFLGDGERGKGFWCGTECVAWGVAFGGTFCAFDGFPVTENLAAVCNGDASKDVGVAADEFCGDLFVDIVEIEFVGLAGDFAVQEDVEEEVAEFFGERFAVIGVKGFEDFVRFFEQSGSQGSMCLFAIPRAAVGSEQAGDDVGDAFWSTEVGEWCQRWKVGAGEVVDGVLVIKFMQRHVPRSFFVGYTGGTHEGDRVVSGVAFQEGEFHV